MIVDAVDVGVVTSHASNDPATYMLDIALIHVATLSHSPTVAVKPAPRQDTATISFPWADGAGPNDSSMALLKTSAVPVHAAKLGFPPASRVTMTFSIPR